MRTDGCFVFFGHPSRFSVAALATLLDAGLRPRAVVQLGRPAAAGAIPVRVAVHAPASPAALADAQGIDVVWLPAIDTPRAERVLAALDAELFVVACFPALLPARVRRLPRRACLNLHPSLLPRYRGPAPLFWQFRNGERAFGVTLHHVAARADAGAIVAQRRVPLARGSAHGEAGALLGRAGAGLFVDVLAQHPSGSLPATPQDESRATAQPAPAAADFALSTAWTAARAFAFMRGTAMWGQPYPIEVGGRRLLLAEALEYRDRAPRRGRVPEDAVWVAFRRGVLLARLGVTTEAQRAQRRTSAAPDM